jgi:hypothetical protein
MMSFCSFLGGTKRRTFGLYHENHGKSKCKDSLGKAEVSEQCEVKRREIFVNILTNLSEGGK